MKNNGLRMGFLLVLLILVGTLIAIWVYPPIVDSHPLAQRLKANFNPPDSVLSYMPTWIAKYEFIGDGLEYASFTRSITFASSELIQIEDLSGTNVVSIMELNPLELRVVWRGEDFYEDRSLLDSWVKNEDGLLPGQAEFLIPLKGPLKQGRHWSDSAFNREIYQVNGQITVPLGTFSDVVVVKSTPLDGSGVLYEYYAKNLGLIKRKSHYNNYTVTSSLTQLEVVSPRVYRGS